MGNDIKPTTIYINGVPISGVKEISLEPAHPTGDADDYKKQIADKIKKEFHVPVYIDLDEMHEWKMDGSWLQKNYITQPAPEPKPEPKKVYLTTRNPYMSRDWKRFFDEQIQANPHIRYFDTDVASMYPAYYVPARGSAKTDPITKALLRQMSNAIHGKGPTESELVRYSPPKQLYEVGKLAAKYFNKDVFKAYQNGLDAVRYSLDEYVKFAEEKTKEEKMKNYENMTAEEILLEMSDMLHRRKCAERYFEYGEWEWWISDDIHRKLKLHDYSVGLISVWEDLTSILGIDVRKTNLKTNYIKLVRKVKEEEKSMNNLYNSKEVIVRAEDGTEYKARINVIKKRCDEPVSMDLYLVDEHPIDKAYNAKPFVTMPRHSGYSEAMKWSQFASEMLYGIDLNHCIPPIKKVMFEDPATIVFWKDGTKTVVRAQDEKFDPEKGLAMAISRKALGNQRDYYNVFLKWLKKVKKKPDTVKVYADDHVVGEFPVYREYTDC